MNKIKFGTDGWRAIIAEEYNFENLSRITLGTLKWLKKKYSRPSVVIGYDCRFGGERFSNLCAKILSSNNVDVIIGNSDIMRIRSANSSYGILKDCRVLIVL